jgi:hypothetical protein
MWPTVFMALCILGLDLLIYLFFHGIYGDKRSAVARQVAAFRGQSPTHSGSFHKRPFGRSRPAADASREVGEHRLLDGLR